MRKRRNAGSRRGSRIRKENQRSRHDGLFSLMTRDHTFVDSLGNRHPRPAIEEGWKGHFDMVPDYR